MATKQNKLILLLIDHLKSLPKRTVLVKYARLGLVFHTDIGEIRAVFDFSLN